MVAVFNPSSAGPLDEVLLLRGQAHDLKNHLQTVVGYCELLPKTADGEKVSSYAGHIRGAALRCNAIATAMMMHSQPARSIGVDLNALLLEEVGMHSPELLRRGINVHVERGASVPPIAMDALELARVILNLAGNAREAILGGVVFKDQFVQARIVFSTVRTPFGAVLSVEDNGPGMTPEVCARIFDSGYSTKDGTGGRRGFGLSVVRSCVESVGGRIEVQTAPGAGTAFRLHLPASEGYAAIDVASPPI